MSELSLKLACSKRKLLSGIILHLQTKSHLHPRVQQIPLSRCITCLEFHNLHSLLFTATPMCSQAKIMISKQQIKITFPHVISFVNGSLHNKTWKISLAYCCFLILEWHTPSRISTSLGTSFQIFCMMKHF